MVDFFDAEDQGKRRVAGMERGKPSSKDGFDREEGNRRDPDVGSSMTDFDIFMTLVLSVCVIEVSTGRVV